MRSIFQNNCVNFSQACVQYLEIVGTILIMEFQMNLNLTFYRIETNIQVFLFIHVLDFLFTSNLFNS